MSREAEFDNNPLAVAEGGAVGAEAGQQEQESSNAMVDPEVQRAEEEKLKSIWGGLLHPDTAVRHGYDFVQLIIMLYLGYLLPLRLAFTKTATGPLEIALDLVIDGSVWVDMFLQMRMGRCESPPPRATTPSQPASPSLRISSLGGGGTTRKLRRISDGGVHAACCTRRSRSLARSLARSQMTRRRKN
jgi:hypothetical protein